MWYGRPYFFFGDWLRDRYKCRVLKLPVNAGLSCPNRDGTISSSGCIFCSEDGSASRGSACSSAISSQMSWARHHFKRIEENTQFIAYFQAFTNTYASCDILKKLYDEAVHQPDVTGLMIGTRPDCISDEAADLIASYKREGFELWVELGMQTGHDRSLKLLNRGHTERDTEEAVKLLHSKNINICLHIILGIPGETWQDMMETARIVSSLHVSGVKFHHLHVIKGTALETMYRENKFSVLSMEEYVSVLCDFIERLRPDIMIHRLMGDRQADSLVAPCWGMHKGTVQKAIEDEFIKRETCQGFLFEGEKF